MYLNEVKEALKEIDELRFILPNGSEIPPHFHITEVGMITKNFIDCGGKIRQEKVINFQLWEANDFDHRLKAEKLLNIINISENKLSLDNAEIEVEYQANTIGKYGLDFRNGQFQLTNKPTACLAEDACGIPKVKPRIKLSSISAMPAACGENSSCC